MDDGMPSTGIVLGETRVLAGAGCLNGLVTPFEYQLDEKQKPAL